MTRSNWTDAQIEQLKDLRADGHSCAAIADTMDLTRNAVIGKLSRLGVDTPDQVKRKTMVRVMFKRPKPQATATQAELEPIGPLRDFPQAGACRFIAGDVASLTWRCCGHPTLSALSPWCGHHFHRVSAGRSAA